MSDYDSKGSLDDYHEERVYIEIVQEEVAPELHWSMSFPMSMGGSRNHASATLPGGRVWGISLGHWTERKIMSLALQ
eukprot:scaffold443_cov125-Cylindrotheca_fusiformis.AAC.49